MMDAIFTNPAASLEFLGEWKGQRSRSVFSSLNLTIRPGLSSPRSEFHIYHYSLTYNEKCSWKVFQETASVMFCHL